MHELHDIPVYFQRGENVRQLLPEDNLIPYPLSGPNLHPEHDIEIVATL